MTARDPRGDESVLARMEAEGRRAPHLRLRDADGTDGGDGARATDALRPSAASRYVVVGELARGGIGIVYQARDFDLGRDVALKMLRPEHLDRADWVRRFLEEAQICGQLQHPSIVPVYELGVREDDCPFFAMRLVRGRTLAALLDEREDLADDRRRFLAVFEQVCQTMAYAHSRGVIHSDLKPANIMVGNYGDVQVIDWGFAKVLAQGGIADERRAKRRETDSTMVATVRPGAREPGTGSDPKALLATPAYMSPEQALGQADALDERADVFSLGAILCEMLTGLPPYTGDQGDLVEVAAQARLDPCLERLAACGAEPELVQLARDCLAPLRRHRPRHAGVVQRRLAEYLEALEARVHRLQLETIRTEARAVRARLQAEGQRRTRRLGLLLVGIAFVVVTAGAFGWRWRTARMGDRAQAQEQAIFAALERAAIAREDRRWNEAQDAVRHAADLAASAAVPDGLRAEIASLREGLDVLAARARAEQERQRRDAALLERLEAIRTAHADDFDAARTEEEFDAAFREELGLAVPEADPAGAAAAIRARGAATAARLASLLDFRAWVLRRAEGADGGWRLLLEVARRVDTDPWRNSVRDLWGRMRPGDDAAPLRALATPGALDRQPPASLDLLGVALLAAGDPDRNLDLLADLQQRRPDDPWTNLRLGLAYERLDPPRMDEALRFGLAALALQPDSGALRVNAARKRFERGRQLLHAGDFAAAREEFVLGASDPALPAVLTERAGTLAQQAARLAALEPRADAVLDRSYPATDDATRIACGDFALFRGRPLVALRWYDAAGRAAAVRPEAARAAVLAGFGVGPGADALEDGARARLRDRGLAAWMRRLGTLPERESRLLARDLMLDLQLAAIRTEESLERLRAEERDGWRAFWERTGRIARRR